MGSGELGPFLVGRDPLFYKSCQTNKAKESCSVWIPKSLILPRVEPNAPVWIDIEGSPSLSCGPCSAADKDELPPRGYYLI